MDYLTKVKSRIGLKDNKQDEQLKVIIENVTAELLSRLPIGMREDVPEGLEFIVIEVTLKRYNRIGAEGMSSESQDGRS
ncbi:phage head-tail connector protein, partial [Staphylococcus hominis]